ncbi:MAG: DUF3617 domain-containing protein [Alcanivorax sp.]|uniref:DUF3617 domain-containing protein n=1 Tax=Alcanivorax sp. TaxID=1872427 RepID=UPI003DA77899
MKQKILVASLLCISAMAVAGDLKPGLWQINTTMEGDNLPPQMRAHTQQDCLSADQAEDVVTALRKDWNTEGCDLGNVDRSGEDLTWEASCNQNGMQSTMKGSVTLHSDTQYTSIIDMTMPGNKMVSTSEGEWVSADCPK